MAEADVEWPPKAHGYRPRCFFDFQINGVPGKGEKLFNHCSIAAREFYLSLLHFYLKTMELAYAMAYRPLRLKYPFKACYFSFQVHLFSEKPNPLPFLLKS